MEPGLQIVTGQGAPDFLDLPWDTMLEEWKTERLVDLARGRSRHIVRMVEYPDGAFAIKETTPELANREYRLLRDLRDERLPTVQAVGVVTGRQSPDGAPLPAALITRYLDYSLPYEYLFSVESPAYLREKLLDAAAVLLVRLHTSGVFWGDASLANVLFRRDAGALMAFLVDAETAEMHPSISAERRDHDLDIASENVAGALFDAIAAGRLPASFDPVEVVEDLVARYEGLWRELMGEERLRTDERWRIQQRVERLNALGFDVEELIVVATDGGSHLVIRPQVVEEGHAHRQLIRLTGLEAQEGQARALLNAIFSYGAWLEDQTGTALPEALLAHKWFTERYLPVIESIPDEYRDRLDDHELFHRFIAHREAISREREQEVDNETAMASFIEDLLPVLPEERRVPDPGPTP